MNIEVIRNAAQKLLAQPKRANNEGTAGLNAALVQLLGCCQRIGAAPPKELIEIIARQLKVAKLTRNETHKKTERHRALMLYAQNPLVSDKKLARLCDVSRPTIAKWKRDPWFIREAELVRAHPHIVGPPNTRRKLRKWTIWYGDDGSIQKAWRHGVDPGSDFPL